jgi:hypothetical protein
LVRGRTLRDGERAAGERRSISSEGARRLGALPRFRAERLLCKTRGVADEHERRELTDERERRDEPVEGAPRGGDPEFHLHSELGEEAKRLATHPREEAHRLSEELKAGEVETTPLIALSGLGIWLGLFIALVIALVFVVAYLV